MAIQFENKEEFFDFYLLEHSNKICRVLHYLASTVIIMCVIAAFVTGKWLLILTGTAVAYALAWIGHFFFEHNKPASFSYPLASLKSDFRMFWCFLTGNISSRMAQARVNLTDKHAASVAAQQE